MSKALFLDRDGTLIIDQVYLADPAGVELIPGTIDALRCARTLGYIESMRFKDGAYGRYRYAADMPEPTLYSSTYAALTRSLYRDLDALTRKQREKWIAYLQSHQDEDGLFRDPRIFGEGWYQGDPEWCGRRHLSCHVVTALTCLLISLVLNSATKPGPSASSFK